MSSMPRFHTFAWILGAAMAVPATSGPRLKFDAIDVNVGTVVRGEDALATFTYRNVGDAPLRILSAKPG